MSELFIEIGVEEIPVAEIGPAIEHLSKTLSGLFKNDGVDFASCTTYATPRRLAVCFRGLSDKGKSEVITHTGPRKEAAFDKDGNPTQAAIGFARSKGVDVNSLKIVKLDKGEFVQVEIKKPGVLTKNLIKKELSGIVLGIPFRKSMRWGGIENSSIGSNRLNRSREENNSIRFIRPIRWLVVLYTGTVIPLSIGKVKASAYTAGLRTGSAKKVKIKGIDSWLKVMEREKILPDVSVRRKSIMKQAEEMAKKINGQAQPDIGLLDTITNLVESPVAITGSFDKRFMNLPQEVIMSVMKTQQKYIPVVDGKSELMSYFIGISNNPYGDKAVIRKGYERVLRARLEDAEFYYREDIKQPLETYVELLKGMTFYPRLGSLYDKTQRIKAIAAYLCEEIKLDEALKVVTLEAARLCKADLATRLVSEFPELQGIIGKQYILKKDASARIIAYAIAEHRNSVPQLMPGALVSIADKTDTVVGFFSIGEVPTGTQDPYGLRRAAISILLTMLPISPDLPPAESGISVNIKELIDFSIGQYKHITNQSELKNSILGFFYTRLEGILKDKYINKDDIDNSFMTDEVLREDIKRRGITTQDVTNLQRPELETISKEYFLKEKLKFNANVNKLIDAVIVTEPENILEADQRVDALKDIVFQPDFEPLQLAFKRVMNISKKHAPGEVNGKLLVEPSEKALYNSYLEAEPKIQSALAKGNYIGYINLIQNLVEPINTFFDKVLVMSDDENIKNNRLNMLAKIKNLVMQVLDITKLI